MPVPAFFILKAGAGYGAVTVKTASQIRMVITGVLKVKRLILYRKKV